MVFRFNGVGRTRLRLKLRPCKFNWIYWIFLLLSQFPDETEKKAISLWLRKAITALRDIVIFYIMGI
jgi:hypothetical protein